MPAKKAAANPAPTNGDTKVKRERVKLQSSYLVDDEDDTWEGNSKGNSELKAMLVDTINGMELGSVRTFYVEDEKEQKALLTLARAVCKSVTKGKYGLQAIIVPNEKVKVRMSNAVKRPRKETAAS